MRTDLLLTGSFHVERSSYLIRPRRRVSGRHLLGRPLPQQAVTIDSDPRQGAGDLAPQIQQAVAGLKIELIDRLQKSATTQVNNTASGTPGLPFGGSGFAGAGPAPAAVNPMQQTLNDELAKAQSRVEHREVMNGGRGSPRRSTVPGSARAAGLCRTADTAPGRPCYGATSRHTGRIAVPRWVTLRSSHGRLARIFSRRPLPGVPPPRFSVDYVHPMSIRVGIVGVSGYGGGEALRLCATPPDTSKSSTSPAKAARAPKLGREVPGHRQARRPRSSRSGTPPPCPSWTCCSPRCPPANPRRSAGQSARRTPRSWTSAATTASSKAGPTAWPTSGPTRIRRSTRVANPGCYPSAVAGGPGPAARRRTDRARRASSSTPRAASAAPAAAAAATFGFAEVNEDVAAYGLLKHAHVPEMVKRAVGRSAGRAVSLTFTPHLIPMTRGILATCYAPRDRDDRRALPRRGPGVLRGPAVRARVGQAAAHQVGDGDQPRLRLLRRRPGARAW